MSFNTDCIISNASELILDYNRTLNIEMYTQEQINNITYMSMNVCCNNGTFNKINQKSFCDCDIGFFDFNCRANGLMFWEIKGWQAFQVIISIIHSLFFLILARYIINQMRNEHGGFLKRLVRLWVCPKYVVVLNLLIICFSRVVYYAVDPYRQYNIFSRTTERVFFELVLSSTVSIFFVLLLVWFGLFTAFDIDNDKEQEAKRKLNPKQPLNWTKTFKEAVKDPLNVIKTAVISVKKPPCFAHYNKFRHAVNYILIVIYPTQIVITYFRSKREFSTALLYIIFGCTMVFFIGFFLYYTIMLKCTLTSSFRNPYINQVDLIKNSNKKPMKKHVSEVTKKDIIQFLKETEKKNVLKSIIRYILEPNRGSSEELYIEDSHLDFDEEMIEIALNDEDSFYSENAALPNVNGTEKPTTEKTKNAFISTTCKDKIEDMLRIDKDHENKEFQVKDNDAEAQEHEITSGKHKNFDSEIITLNKKLATINSDQINSKMTIIPQHGAELNQVYIDPKKIMKTINQKKRAMSYIVTSNDMIVLDKIFCLSIFIVFISIMIILIGISLSLSNVLKNYVGSVALIVFESILEIIGMLAIIFLFVVSIDSTEYANLKIIGEIESYVKESKNKSLVFTNISLIHVFSRLKAFLNIKEKEVPEEEPQDIIKDVLNGGESGEMNKMVDQNSPKGKLIH